MSSPTPSKFGLVLAVKYMLAPVHTRIQPGEPVRTSCWESDFNFNRKPFKRICLNRLPGNICPETEGTARDRMIELRMYA